MKCSEQPASGQVVDVEESMWALDEDWDGSTDATRSLMISLARPAPTPEEITWKKGDDQTHAHSVPKLVSTLVLFKQFLLWHGGIQVQLAV